VAPLTLAKDAIYIDTTNLPIAEVVEKVMAIVASRAGR
jgi:cytidylate kinase